MRFVPTPNDNHRTVTQRAETSARLVASGLLLNLVLGAAKLAGGIWGHSYALLADGTWQGLGA